jgi:hypothetical protein
MGRDTLRDRMIALVRSVLPEPVRRLVVGVRRALRLQWPPAGTVRFGSLRRLTPISPVCGMDRGQPIDRYYVEKFLDRHREDLKGDALEFGDTRYLDQFGGDRVRRKAVFSYVTAPRATIVGDLAGERVLAPNAFDAIVCVFTLQMISDMPLAVRRLHAMLKPGGVLLAASNGIVRTTRHLDTDGWAEYWHLTQQGARSLFAMNFPGDVDVIGYGSVLSAVASLHGLAASELSIRELDATDRDYDVVVAVRAVKAADLADRATSS